MTPERTRARSPLRPRPSSETETGGTDRFPGLCSSCRHTRTCTLPRRTDRPTLHCEEFELADDRAGLPVQAGLGRPSAAGESGEPVLGLCRTCENLAGCMHARAQGGIWHCEEYR